MVEFKFFCTFPVMNPSDTGVEPAPAKGAVCTVSLQEPGGHLLKLNSGQTTTNAGGQATVTIDDSTIAKSATIVCSASLTTVGLSYKKSINKTAPLRSEETINLYLEEQLG